MQLPLKKEAIKEVVEKAEVVEEAVEEAVEEDLDDAVKRYFDKPSQNASFHPYATH